MHLPDDLPLFSRGHTLPDAITVMEAIGDLQQFNPANLRFNMIGLRRMNTN